jgi:hypothetical protein
MMAIPREAGRITYSTKIREMKKTSLSEYQKTVLIGTILGDACLESNWSKTNYRLQVRQSKEQEAYVSWKYEIFKDFVLTPPQHYKTTNSVWFRTISHPDITKFYLEFYPHGKKIIPLDTIAELLQNPLTIAVWFMDDGNIVRRKGKIQGYHLNTQSFSQEENELLSSVLRSTYGISCSVEKNHTYFRLAIYRQYDRERFVELIREYIQPSMQYKIS